MSGKKLDPSGYTFPSWYLCTWPPQLLPTESGMPTVKPQPQQKWSVNKNLQEVQKDLNKIVWDEFKFLNQKEKPMYTTKTSKKKLLQAIKGLQQEIDLIVNQRNAANFELSDVRRSNSWLRDDLKAIQATAKHWEEQYQNLVATTCNEKDQLTIEYSNKIDKLVAAYQNTVATLGK